MKNMAENYEYVIATSCVDSEVYAISKDYLKKVKGFEGKYSIKIFPVKRNVTGSFHMSVELYADPTIKQALQDRFLLAA